VEEDGNMPKVPIYDRQVGPETVAVPSPNYATPPQDAFGGQVVEAQAGTSKVLGTLGDTLLKYAEIKDKEKKDRINSELDSQFRINMQNSLFNDQEESYVKDGVKSKRKKGYLSRTGTQADGSLVEFDKNSMAAINNTLSSVRDPAYRNKLANSLYSQFHSARQSVMTHEAGQNRIVNSQAQKDNLELLIQDTAREETFEGVERNILLSKEKVDAWAEAEGLPKESKVLAEKEYANRILASAIEASLQRDISGGQGAEFLEQAKKKGHITDDEYNDQKESLLNMAQKQATINSFEVALASLNVNNDVTKMYQSGELTMARLNAIKQENPYIFGDTQYKAWKKVLESAGSIFGNTKSFEYNGIVQSISELVKETDPTKLKKKNKSHEFDDILAIKAEAITKLAEGSLTSEEFNKLDKIFEAVTTENKNFQKKYMIHATVLDHMAEYANEITRKNYSNSITADTVTPLEEYTSNATMQLYRAYIDNIAPNGRLPKIDTPEERQQILERAEKIKTAVSKEIALQIYDISTDAGGIDEYVRHNGSYYKVLGYPDGSPMVDYTEAIDDIESPKKVNPTPQTKKKKENPFLKIALPKG
jgi:hypothetical protein